MARLAGILIAVAVVAASAAAFDRLYRRLLREWVLTWGAIGASIVTAWRIWVPSLGIARRPAAGASRRTVGLPSAGATA